MPRVSAIRLRAVRLEQHRGQRRRQRQRVEGRDHRRDGDRQRELAVELAGQTADERHRHEHRAQHQRDGDDRAADLAHRRLGGLAWRQAFGDVALDVLDHHDGIVDDDADGQHQAEQRQRVDGEAEGQQHREGADDRDRHGDQRNDRGAPGLQEQDDHQHDQRDGFEQGVHHRLDRLAHEHRRVVDDPVVHALREILLELLHGLAHRRRTARARWRPGAWKIGMASDGLVVEQAAHAVGLRAELDARDVAQAHDLAVVAGLDDDVAELLLVGEAARGVERDLELGVGRGRRADLAGRHLHVLLADRARPRHRR